MARILDEAAIRIQSETTHAERDAKRSGERVGRKFAAGADRGSRGALQDVISDAAKPLAEDARKAGEDAGTSMAGGIAGKLRDLKGRFVRAGGESGDQFRQGFEDEIGKKTLPAPPVDDAPVKLVPLDDAFKKRIKAMIKEVEKGAATIPLDAKGELLRRKVATQVAEIEKSLKGEIPFDPELAAGFRQRLEAKAKAASLGVGGTIHFDTDTDRGLRGIGARFREVTSLAKLAGSTFGEAGKIGSSVFGQMGSVLAAVGGEIAQMAAGAQEKISAVAGFAGKILGGILAFQYVIPAALSGVTLLGGAAIAAFGAITAGVAGLPVLITGILAPIAAIALGMEGLKRAAVNLTAPMADLKRGVSDAFANTFRPVMDSLVPLVGSLKTGLIGLVTPMAHFAGEMTRVVTSADGLRKVESALVGVGLLLDNLRPGAVALLQAFLDIASTHELYRILGDTISGVAERVAGMFQRLRESGTLTGALKALEGVLFSVTDLILLLAEGSVKFFEKAGPGLKSFFDSLVQTLSKLDWGSLGEAFGSMMERIGKAILAVPAETWRNLGEAIGAVVDQFIRFMESGGLESTIDTITGLINTLGFFQKVLNGISGLDPNFWDSMSPPPGKQEETEGFFTGLGSSISNFFTTTLPETVGGFFTTTLPGIIGTGLASIGTFITATLPALGASITTGITVAFAGMVGFLTNLPNIVAYWLGYAVTTAALKASELFWGVVNWVAQLPGKIGEFLGFLGQKIADFFTALPGWVAEKSSLVFWAVVNWFAQLPGKIGEFLADLGGRIGRFFSELPGKLAEAAGNVVRAVVDKFKELPGQVVEQIKKMVDDAIQWFKDLPGKLKQAAKDAIDGFIQGLQDKAMELYNKAKGVIDSALQGARDAIAAQSPSRKFAELGRYSIDGFILGLRDRIAPMLAQIKAVFGAAMATARDQLSAANLPDLNAGIDLSGTIGTGRAPFPTAAEIERAFAAALARSELRADGADLALTVRNAEHWWAVR